MRNKISRYEENQVDRFLYDLYLLWGGNLDEDMCIEENIRMFIVMDDEIEIKKLPLFLRDIKHLRREHRSVIEIAEEIAGIIKQM